MPKEVFESYVSVHHSLVTDLVQLIENILSAVNVTRILPLGNFNLDQMLQENVNKMYALDIFVSISAYSIQLMCKVVV